jgi:hypothetical protein
MYKTPQKYYLQQMLRTVFHSLWSLQDIYITFIVHHAI